MKAKIRTIFMGTPEFALPGLKALISDPDFELLTVYTQPDRPSGRANKMTPPPIKRLAQENNIPVIQPLKIKKEVETIKSLNPDLIVIIAYGQIIPQAILDIPKFGCINVHASLLPKYRGASCLSAPILNGDKESGVTIMLMDAKMDTGPIIKQEKIILSENETGESIHDKLSALGAELLPVTLKKYIKGEIEPQRQDDKKVSYVQLTKKSDGYLNPQNDAKELERQIRAYYPWPGTFLKLENGETIKIISAKIKQKDEKHKIGEIFLSQESLALSCGQDDLFILELQRENRKALPASEFLKGNRDIIGKIAK